MKQIIYWLSVVAPIVDGIKTTCKCISAGIEAGKADVQKAKEQAEADSFLDLVNSNSLGLEEFFKENKNGK